MPTSPNADNPKPPTTTTTGAAPAPPVPPRDRHESWLRRLGAQDAIKESIEELLTEREEAGG